MMQRLLLYVHYNPKQQLDDHIVFQLTKIQALFSKIVFISNSTLSEREVENIELISPKIEVCTRENKGYDFLAWKNLLGSIGRSEIEKYDSLTLMNSTCFGPVKDMTSLFQNYEKDDDIDFWGLTNFRATKLFPEHIQSYFISFKKQIIVDDTFYDFWSQVKEQENVKQVIHLYESQLTSKLVDKGFKWDCVFDTAQLSAKDMIDPDFSFYKPLLCLEKGVPLLKVKAIEHNPYEYEEIRNWIESNSTYEFGFIDSYSKDYFSIFFPPTVKQSELFFEACSRESKDESIDVVLLVDTLEDITNYVNNMGSEVDRCTFHILMDKQTVNATQEWGTKGILINFYNSMMEVSPKNSYIAVEDLRTEIHYEIALSEFISSGLRTLKLDQTVEILVRDFVGVFDGGVTGRGVDAFGCLRMTSLLMKKSTFDQVGKELFTTENSAINSDDNGGLGLRLNYRIMSLQLPSNFYTEQKSYLESRRLEMLKDKHSYIRKLLRRLNFQKIIKAIQKKGNHHFM